MRPAPAQTRSWCLCLKRGHMHGATGALEAADLEALVARAEGLAQQLRLRLRETVVEAPVSEEHDDEEFVQVVLRRTVWAGLCHARFSGQPGTPGSASSGVARVAATLGELHYALGAVRAHVRNLHRKLTDAAADRSEAFFGGGENLAELAAAAEGCLANTAAVGAALAEAGAELGRYTSVWVELPDPEVAAESLLGGASALRDVAEKVAKLQPASEAARVRRRASKTLSAATLTQSLLAGTRPVDDTAVAALQRLLDEDTAADFEEVVGVLSGALKISGTDEELSRALRALSVLLKLAADDVLRKTLAMDGDLAEALAGMAHVQAAPGLLEERARELAEEVEHALDPLSKKGNLAALPAALCSGFFKGLPHLLSAMRGGPVSVAGGAVEVFIGGAVHNDLWGSVRRSAEELCRKLQWCRNVPRSAGAVALLDGLFAVLDALTGNLARLHEELLCLADDGEGGETTDVPALLFMAASLQSSALDWKSKLLDRSAGDGGGRAEAPAKKWVRAALRTQASRFSGFLLDAVAAGDCLDTRCGMLAARRRQAVERLMITTEASGQAALCEAKADVCAL